MVRPPQANNQQGLRQVKGDRLRQRSWQVNRKRIRRLMRENNLPRLRRRRAMRTTEPFDLRFGH